MQLEYPAAKQVVHGMRDHIELYALTRMNAIQITVHGKLLFGITQHPVDPIDLLQLAAQ